MSEFLCVLIWDGERTFFRNSDGTETPAKSADIHVTDHGLNPPNAETVQPAKIQPEDLLP